MDLFRARFVFVCLAWLLIFSPNNSIATDRDPPLPFYVMAAAGISYLNDTMECPGLLSAQVILDNLDDFTVIDIRSLTAYRDGHIPGAFHSSLESLLDDLASTLPSDKPYVIACYTGQIASQAKMAMELLGYGEVFCLLYGMSSWNSDLDSWTSNCANHLTMPETANQNGNLVGHAFPYLEGDLGTIVEQQVTANLAQGFKGLDYLDIADHLEDYFIINYFDEADYLGQGSAGAPGHIPGAFQFTPHASLGVDQMLDNIPPEMAVVVYDWTGHHSTAVVSYLNMLGYEAYSLNFGANSLFYDELTAHKWSAATQYDFELEYGYPPSGTFATIATALGDYINDSLECPGVISAPSLFDNLQAYTVIDIRSAESYDEGHIPGAYPSSLATLLGDVGSSIPTYKPLVVACYTGQVSGFAKIALEMVGYEDTKSLKWGMSSRNSDLDYWSNRIDDLLANPETVNNNDALTYHNYPSLEGETLEARVELLLAGGFKGLHYSSISDHLQDYFIINYFSESDYLGEGVSGVPGHIPGAFQFTPYASMGIGQMLGNIPTDMPVVVYGWTGQHSNQIAAYLNMLGYEAYSLKFGCNSLFHSQLVSHRWGSYAQNDFPFVTVDVPDYGQPLVAFLKNYPNPFNPSTTINYRLAKPALASLRVYDLAGHLIRTLVNDENQLAGLHEFTWSGRDDKGQNVPSGTYFYRLEAGDITLNRRMMILK